MSAWDLTCRPPATSNAVDGNPPNRTTAQVNGSRHHNDRLAKLRQQQVIIPFVMNATATNQAAPLVWATNTKPNQLITNAGATNEQLQALLTTASSTTSLSQHVAWLDALRQQQDLARQCSMIGAPAAALNITTTTTTTTRAPPQQQSGLLGSTLLLNSQYNSGQSSASSSPGSRRSPVESVDLTLTRRLILPLVAASQAQQANANKPQRPPSSSISLSSSSSSSSSSPSDRSPSSSSSTSSRANSFDGDYTLVPTDDNHPISNTTGGGDSNCRVDRRARKKDQNRRAAYNYRRKKMEERDRMIEEEARLVHKHVRLAGKIARLEEKILTILGTKTRKVSDPNGFLVYHLCPVCMSSCVNITTLRDHIKTQHHQQQHSAPNNTVDTKKEPWSMPLGRTMSAPNDDGLGVMDDDDEDSYPKVGTKNMPNRDKGARCTMPEDDMIDHDDEQNH